ncbi:CU044_2847 family protein [Streptomyces sp. DH41]|uniref:CU044_2847 family protein n=1 Tax=Streptomyces sp. DH41 TaxID=3040125 RepID=UPI002442B7DC|nr:CU044_2847 family protein [Streptomyces sp. DH41]MDG9721845.1 CU044_2847 family protein [Streptomyces sp. DH41]
MSHIQDVELPDGTVITARISEADEYDGQQDVGFTEAAVAKVERLQELITGVGSSVLSAARAAGPSEAAITFGVELTAKEGLAVAVLARGETKASLEVTLTWRFDRPDGQVDTRVPAAHE